MTFSGSVDPFVFEIVRHRLWTINVEGALALQRVSGSPLATEASDMNTSLMTPDGDVVFVGPYLLTGPMGQGLLVKTILEDYSQNPGIEQGDMFISNDPYSGAAHQNCVTVVAPIFDDDKLIAWCGATLHVIDVGGPRAGQVGFGASSIFEEAPVIPPLKIVRRGELLKDVEANYLRRSRTPALNALDLRGKIAALNTISRRVGELVEEYGADFLMYVMEAAVDRSERILRARLADLPDGSYRHTAYLDRMDVDPSETYAVDLRLTKDDDRVVLDLTNSSLQAGAVVNCTRSALMSGVVIAALTYLGYETDWCLAAVERVLEVKSRPGTVVDATWPAGCSMATMAAGFAVTTATAVCLGRLLSSSTEARDRAMATWAGAVGSVDVFGSDADDRPFGTVLLDSMVSGTGARTWADGIDGGGFLRSIGCVVANIESYEARFPLLYLFRRLEPDTGGPGMFRGGAGCAYAVIAHGVDEIQSITPHFSGTRQPESLGLGGGYPGALNRPFVVRESQFRSMFEAGFLPASIEELSSEPTYTPGIINLSLGTDDVFGVVVTGGGGWGDPLERDPDRVEIDVLDGLIRSQWARDIYGVVILDDGSVDQAATLTLRDEMRRDRQERARTDRSSAPGPDLRREELLGESGRSALCWSCSTETRFSDLPSAVRPLSVAGPHTGTGDDSDFDLVEWYCPSCWRLVNVDRLRSRHGQVM